MQPDDSTTYRGSMPRTTDQLREWHAQAVQEPALEPELPILDAHHHLFGTPGMSQYYQLPDLERDLGGGHRIFGTVYVEAYQSGWRQDGPEALRPVGEVEMIVAMTREPLHTRHGDCQVAAAIVGSVDLTLGTAAAAVLDAQLAAGEGRFRGVRHHAAYDDGLVGSFIKHLPKQHVLLDPDFRRGFAELQPRGLGFDAWIYHNQMAELVDLADAFPETRIVMNHVGGVIGVGKFRAERDDVLARWRQDLRELARRPNVLVKIGGLGMPVFGFGFEHGEKAATSSELAQAWQPFIEACIAAFGTERCMFESNFPVDKQSTGYTQLWNAFKLCTRSLSPDERSALFHRTACHVYGVAPPAM